MKPIPLFDSHFHIIDPRFPLVENQGYLPPAFGCEDYRRRMSDYRLLGGAVVSGSFQAFDQDYLVTALQDLGETYVGVTQLPASYSDEEILKLDREGVRALRFNLKRGGSEGVNALVSMAQRVYELVKWHVEFYVDSRELLLLEPLLSQLPKFSIDHLGLSEKGLPHLLRYAEKGAYIKASGFSRVDMDVKKALKSLYAANPSCLMFGSDLPSTRAPLPYMDRDYELVYDLLSEGAAEKLFFRNALAFYRLPLSSLSS